MGTFTADAAEWMPAAVTKNRADFTFPQLCDLLRATLAGAPCPPQWRDADDLLGDVHLVGHNTLNRALAAAESHQRRGAAARASTARAWQVVFAAGKRKTLAAADIRAALEGPG